MDILTIKELEFSFTLSVITITYYVLDIVKSTDMLQNYFLYKSFILISYFLSYQSCPIHITKDKIPSLAR